MKNPLQVILAGMNVDTQALDEAKTRLEYGNDFGALNTLSKLTPETISASYARISRDERPIPELRNIARKEVEDARKINKNVIFTMGHKSIAEHAFFNIDIMGLSRRAVEELERKRLQSYTEKSQRYITLKGDFVIPPEIINTPLEKEFVELIEKQNKFYKNNLNTLIAWHIKQNSEMALNPKKKDTLEGYGKEDARYALAMATQAQIGLSLSARNLESLVTELRSSESEEVRNLGKKINEVVDGVAPSVIKYTGVTDYYSKTRRELREYVNELIKGKGKTRDSPDLRSKNIKLFTKLKRDESIPAGIIFSSSNLRYQDCLETIKELNREEKIELLKKADIYQKVHDPKLREYELGDRIAEITLSSSAFAQLKRHRMNTLISQEYLPNCSITNPESVINTSLQKDLIEIANESSMFYKKMLAEGLPTIVAEYSLTNAHRRRVLLDANNRQIYAICAERENKAAQWDIRHLSNELHNLIQKESPLTTAYLCGKDTFDKIKTERYY